MEQPYSKREIDEKIKFMDAMMSDLKSQINENHQDVMVAIKSVHNEQKLTNGNVRRLQVWRAGIVAGLSVITTLVLPILVYEYFIINSRVAQIESIFTKYDVEVIK